MDGTAERGSDQHPERAGEVTELRCQNRADERAGTCNRGKVMTEDHPAVCRDEIFPIRMPHRRSASLIFKRQNLGQQPCGVKTVGQGECADGCHDQPEGINRLIPDKRDRGKGDK